MSRNPRPAPEWSPGWGTSGSAQLGAQKSVAASRIYAIRVNCEKSRTAVFPGFFAFSSRRAPSSGPRGRRFKSCQPDYLRRAHVLNRALTRPIQLQNQPRRPCPTLAIPSEDSLGHSSAHSRATRHMSLPAIDLNKQRTAAPKPPWVMTVPEVGSATCRGLCRSTGQCRPRPPAEAGARPAGAPCPPTPEWWRGWRRSTTATQLRSAARAA
jgi:hypothetical protein